MQNQVTKSDNTVRRIVAGMLLFMLVGVVALTMHLSNQPSRDEQKQYIDSLIKQSRQSFTFDSIRSVIEKRLIDSIGNVRKEIEIERAARRRETQNIRRETQKIRHRLDSIGPIDRPKF
jgi:hypothetical protein